MEEGSVRDLFSDEWLTLRKVQVVYKSHSLEIFWLPDFNRCLNGFSLKDNNSLKCCCGSWLPVNWTPAKRLVLPVGVGVGGGGRTRRPTRLKELSFNLTTFCPVSSLRRPQAAVIICPSGKQSATPCPSLPLLSRYWTHTPAFLKHTHSPLKPGILNSLQSFYLFIFSSYL